jgi:catechol 2,3-dioxygenase-like lactoylglutathione lyase family enzyme
MTMSRPSIHGVLETCLYSDDLARAARFYQDTLGLRVLEAGERLCVFVVTDQQVLLVFRRGSAADPVPTAGGVIPPHDGIGALHVAFAVSKGDFSAWEKYLGSRGVPIESKVRWSSGGESLFIRDPDGHLLELATQGLWRTA